MSPEQILLLVGIFLAAWYLFASIYNRRRGTRTYRWVRDGLDPLGDKFEGKWLGSAASGAHITIAKARSPFRRVEIIFLLESRELLPLWLVDIVRNKRDQVIFKATVRGATRQANVEIVPNNGRAARRMQKEADSSWRLREKNGLLIAEKGLNAAAVTHTLSPILEKYGHHIRQISWSNHAPHLIAIFNLPQLIQSEPDATPLFTSLHNALER